MYHVTPPGKVLLMVITEGGAIVTREADHEFDLAKFGPELRGLGIYTPMILVVVTATGVREYHDPEEISRQLFWTPK